MIDAKGSLVYLRHDGGLLKVAPGRNSATRLDDNVRDAFATTRGVVIYIRSDGTVLAMNRNYSGGSALENSISLDTAKRRLIETSHGTYYLRPDGTLLWVALTSPIVKDNGVRYGMADANGNLVYLRHDGVLLKVPPDHNGATKLDLNVRDAFATAHGVVIYTRRDGAVLAMNLNYDGATPLETDISLNTAKQRLKETSSGTYYLRSEGTLLWLAPAGAAVIENGKKPMTEVEPNPAD
jgi:ribosomal protein L24E